MSKTKLFNINKTVVLLATAALLFSACKKKAFYNLTCKDKNLTAMIDGKPFYSCSNTVVNTAIDCRISSYNGRSALTNKYMILALNFPPAVGTYTSGNSFATASIQIGITGSVYMTDSLHTVTINVTKYDLSSKLTSGTFSFSGLEFQSGSGSKNVTDGEFTDVKLQ